MNESRYRVGWVVDWDMPACMICLEKFGWFNGRFAHHCRACGSVVCHGCSPYLADLPGLEESRGSRVCRNCFGLKPGALPAASEQLTPQLSPASTTMGGSSMFGTPSPSTAGNSSFKGMGHNGSGTSIGASTDTDLTSGVVIPAAVASRRYPHSKSIISPVSPTSSSSALRLGSDGRPGYRGTAAASETEEKVEAPRGWVHRRGQAGRKGRNGDVVQAHYGKDGELTVSAAKELEAFEAQQRPVYEAAYRKMREFVPLNIHKTNLQTLIQKRGMPEDLAHRVWNTKILWLICMHSEDIYKVLADMWSACAVRLGVHVG